MQTFLPYPNFAASVRCLDYRRLGKQRVEAKQILNALAGDDTIVRAEDPRIKATIPTKGWSKHPATRMWRGYEQALMLYHDCAIRAWMRLGYRNSMPLYWPELDQIPKDIEMPYWLGDEDFHASHRSNLLYKNREHYRIFGWTDPVRLPYVWPKEKGK